MTNLNTTTKKTNKQNGGNKIRVYEAAKLLGVSSQEMMLLTGEHHWFCSISVAEFFNIKDELNNKNKGGNTMKQRVEIKAEEMMRIFKEGGSFVLTLEGIESFGVKGNTEYHLNGKKVIAKYEANEENIQCFIDMVNDECYEDWKVWEVINGNELAHKEK